MLKRFSFMFVILLALSAEAHAAKRIPQSKIFVVTSGGKTVRCALNRGVAKLVFKQGRVFLLGKDQVAALVNELKESGQSKSPQGKRRLKALKAKVRNGDAACQSTPGSSNLNQLARAITREDIQYLLDKAALGLSSREESLVTLGLEQGIDALVDELMTARAEPDGLLSRVLDRRDGHMGSATTQTPAGQRAALFDLWLHTNNPYHEKFALFLLSVWTVAGDVISDETFRGEFWDYYSRLRDSAYGNEDLRVLALALTRNPLMLKYLNNDLNVKDAPNENYARELMELFTLGPTGLDGAPNYTETKRDGTGDIAVAARMLTGWVTDTNYATNQLDADFVAEQHSPGPHIMFRGKPYEFSGDNDEDLVNGIFDHHPGVRDYYAKEILKVYVTPNPPVALVKAFAAVIHEKGYRLPAAMKVLLKSEAFFDATYRNTVPLNSFEFAVKSARLLEMFGSVNVEEAQRQVERAGFTANLSPSVFWYNPDSWSSPSVIVEKANFLSQALDDGTAQDAGGWSASKVLPEGSVEVAQVIATAKKRIGIVGLSAAQNDSLLSYLSNEKQWGGGYLPFVYDNTNAEHQAVKGLGLYYLLLMTPEFNLL